MFPALPYHMLSELPKEHESWPLYDAIVIDEAQDLTSAMFQVLLRVQGNREETFFILGDATQNVYGSYFQWSKIGFQAVGHVTVLKKCFRSTKQIVQAASPLINEVNYLGQYMLGEDIVV